MARSGKRAMARVMSETPATQCMENPAVRRKEATVQSLSPIHEVCALVRSFLSTMRALKFSTAHREVWLFG
jgi:hypothetical protein